MQKQRLKLVSKRADVIVGEWCISNAYANNYTGENGMTQEQIKTERKRRYREVAELQIDAWRVTKGDIYWSYKFGDDALDSADRFWKESWDARHCIENQWLPVEAQPPLP